MKMKSLALAVAAVVGLALGAASTNANTIQLISTSGGGTGPYTYNFSVELTPNNGLINNTVVSTEGVGFGSGFVVLDFPGVVTSASKFNIGGGLTPHTDWTLTTVATGAGPMTNTAFSGTETTLFANVAQTVEAHGADTVPLNNFVLSYNGGTIAASPGQKVLFGLAITSDLLLAPNTPIKILSRDTSSGNTPEVATFTARVSVIPVPAAAWMGLTTLAGLAGMGVIRRRRVQA